MKYRVVATARAISELAQFAESARAYSEAWALGPAARLEHVIMDDLPRAPHQWSYFYLTGAPYRAYLFRVGRRIQYWIVYTVDEETNTVNILRFWNASQDYERFRL
jgi:mRNA-degrading endonuclease RelE of RelBE toxin-antitoxin system